MIVTFFLDSSHIFCVMFSKKFVTADFSLSLGTLITSSSSIIGCARLTEGRKKAAGTKREKAKQLR